MCVSMFMFIKDDDVHANDVEMAQFAAAGRCVARRRRTKKRTHMLMMCKFFFIYFFFAFAQVRSRTSARGRAASGGSRAATN